jgi:hypothetical protein
MSPTTPQVSLAGKSILSLSMCILPLFATVFNFQDGPRVQQPIKAYSGYSSTTPGVPNRQLEAERSKAWILVRSCRILRSFLRRNFLDAKALHSYI